MKIIQVTPYYPPHLGGMEQRIRDLSERLAKKGHDVEVFTSNIRYPKNKQIKSTKNLKIHYLKSWEFAHTPIAPSLFFRLMRIPKDSIMHVHVSQPLVPEIAWLVSKLRGIPYVAHIRGDPDKSGKLGFLLPFYKKIFLKRVLKDSNKVIVLTKDYKYFISKKYNLSLKKITSIPNSTNFSIIQNNKKENNPKKKLLFVGRLSVQKNIPVLLESFNRLIKRNHNLELDIVGDGEEKEDIINFINKNGLNNKVILFGRLEGKKLKKMYKNSDIFLLVSKDEGFSTTLLEAMATSTPIIASDILGTRSVIKKGYNGLLVKPTPENIAEAIEKLIKNPKLRERLAKNGLKEVKKYSWNKIIAQTEKVYREVLKEHNKK